MDGFVSPADMNLAGVSALVAAGELVACATAPFCCVLVFLRAVQGDKHVISGIRCPLPRLMLTRFLCPAGLGVADGLTQRWLPLPPAHMSESGPVSYSGRQAGWTRPVRGGPCGAASSCRRL